MSLDTSFDWSKIASDLERLLKLRSIPFGIQVTGVSMPNRCILSILSRLTTAIWAERVMASRSSSRRLIQKRTSIWQQLLPPPCWTG